jgi:hypothetical protein
MPLLVRAVLTSLPSLLLGHRLGALHARPRGGHDGLALVARQQIAQHHHARMLHGGQHLHLAVAGVDQRSAVGQIGLGQARRARRFGRAQPAVDLQLRHRLQGQLALPAGLRHGDDQIGGLDARLQLLLQPAAQFRRDVLRHEDRWKTQRCGVEWRATQA